jgi:hypothetical protein
MTFREKLKEQHPESVGEQFMGGCDCCPYDYGYAEKPEYCTDGEEKECRMCWDREAMTDKPKILDSGNRTVFESGAVRDVQEGKGRCDLMPLQVISNILEGDSILYCLAKYQQTENTLELYKALRYCTELFKNTADMCLELAIHFEEGCKKYGERNWEKGIPVQRYIDSAVRHYLKYLRGDKDERHDRALVWNICCLIWTVDYKPSDVDLGEII